MWVVIDVNVLTAIDEPKLKSKGKSTCQPKIILSLFMVFDSTDQVKLNQIVKKNPNNSVDSSSGVQNEGRSKPTKQPLGLPPTQRPFGNLD